MTASIRRLVAVTLLLGTIVAPSAAQAWGDEGHEIIALVHISISNPGRARQSIGFWPRTTIRLPPPDIASRTTWADKYCDRDRHTSQRRYRLTRAWHFVDIELDHPNLAAACFGHPAAELPASAGPANACIVDRVNAFAAELHELSSDDPERVLALKFVLHLVGDIHQPLHAADNHDSGGNSVLVLTGRETVGRPLHAYWDTGVVRQLGRDPSQVAASLEQRFGEQCRAWMAGTPGDWAMESFGIARDMVYQLGEPTTDEREQPVFRLSAAYRHAADHVAAEQLEKAGCRLAMVLNRALER